MTVAAAVSPAGQYSLRLSARLATEATRRFRDGRLDALLDVRGRLGRVGAEQRVDGVVALRAESEAALERLRFPSRCSTLPSSGCCRSPTGVPPPLRLRA